MACCGCEYWDWLPSASPCGLLNAISGVVLLVVVLVSGLSHEVP